MKIQKNHSLAQETTFGCGGKAKWFCEAQNLSEYKNLLALHKGKLFILGAGSKTLCPDEGYDGLVISTKKLTNIAVEDGLLVCEAGVKFETLQNFCIKHNLSGLEWSAGIPASVGGAVVMNCGSGKHQFCENVEKVEVFQNGKVQILEKTQIQFGYRHSSLKGRPVLRVWLKLDKSEKVEEKYLACYAEKFANQPAGQLSAGSIFKRTKGVIPAKIIDKLGLKGVKIGGAEVSKHHSGFIINNGFATATDVLDLIAFIKRVAQQKCGVVLENELIVME